LAQAVPPFRADQVGSLLRSKRLAEARAKREKNEISAHQLHAIEDEEIRLLIKKQEEIGLHAITDGEYRRAWWHFDFLERLAGVEKFEPEQGI
jgi:methionine synthase II (cobalamin-independent)